VTEMQNRFKPKRSK